MTTMTNDEKIVSLVSFLSEHFWKGRLPEREKDAQSVATILFWLCPEDAAADAYNRIAFLLAQSFDILRRQRAATWVN